MIFCQGDVYFGKVVWEWLGAIVGGIDQGLQRGISRGAKKGGEDVLVSSSPIARNRVDTNYDTEQSRACCDAVSDPEIARVVVVDVGSAVDVRYDRILCCDAGIHARVSVQLLASCFKRSFFWQHLRQIWAAQHTQGYILEHLFHALLSGVARGPVNCRRCPVASVCYFITIAPPLVPDK